MRRAEPGGNGGRNLVREGRRSGLSLTVAAIGCLSVATPAFAKASPPTVSGLELTHASVGVLGAQEQLSGEVAGASKCIVTSRASVPGERVSGLPRTSACSTGRFALTLALPLNHTRKAVTETVTLRVKGAGGATSANVTAVIAAAPRGSHCIEPESNESLSGCDFRYADLEGLHVREWLIENVDLEGANLRGAVIGSARAYWVNFTGADFEGASISDAQMGIVKWSGANLDESVFANADLSGDLQGVSLQGANLAGAILGEPSGEVTGTPAALPARWRLIDGYLLGPGADAAGAALADAELAGADLAGADLANADLQGADLQGANLRQITAPEADLEGADLAAAGLEGANLGRADLSGSDLEAADLELAYLESANLEGAALAGANVERSVFVGSRLRGVSSGSITGEPRSLPEPGTAQTESVPYPWSLEYGYLLGPGADLRGAQLAFARLFDPDLQGANLENADLEGTELADAELGGAQLVAANLRAAHLEQAELTGADVQEATFEHAFLSQVRSGAITGSPVALPMTWTLRFGYLLGPSANLDSADLIGLDLTGIDLEYARLKRANLEGAILTPALVEWVEWNGAICPDGSASAEHGETCKGHLTP